MATGVLLICLGRATRVVSFLTDWDKEYRVRIRLGVSTDTFDADGRVVSTSESVPSDLETVRRAVECFEGEIEQLPPMYSAVKVGGRKLYELARRGEVARREPRKVRVHRIEIGGMRGADLDLRIVCSKGTYVRALADDLGRSLGCGGHVAVLRRTRVGDVRIEDCETIPSVEELVDKGELASRLLPLDLALMNLPGLKLEPHALARFCRGAAVGVSGATFEDSPSQVRVSDADGQVYGIGEWNREGSLRATTVLRAAEP